MHVTGCYIHFGGFMGSHISGITSITYSFLRNVIPCVRYLFRIFDFLKEDFKSSMESTKAGVQGHGPCHLSNSLIQISTFYDKHSTYIVLHKAA